MLSVAAPKTILRSEFSVESEKCATDFSFFFLQAYQTLTLKIFRLLSFKQKHQGQNSDVFRTFLRQ